MIQFINPIIYIVTVLVLIVVIIYAVGSKKQIVATLTQKQTLQDGSIILTFLTKTKNKLNLNIGQQILIRTTVKQNGIQFTPIQSGNGSFKILIIPSMQQNNQVNNVLKQLNNLKINDRVLVSFVKNHLDYVGNSQIRIKTAQNKVYAKKFKNIYILAQGNKVPIAYQIIKGICQQKTQQKPKITVLFVGGSISDFSLKNQFEHLEQNYDNLKYFYSIPVKGQRQPSISGMGISSQKVSQSFDSDVSQTFCILCAEQSDLCVTVERSLLNKKVPSYQIYKY